MTFIALAAGGLIKPSVTESACISGDCIEGTAIIERVLTDSKSKAPSVGLAMVPEGFGAPQTQLGAPASSTDSMVP